MAVLETWGTAHSQVEGTEAGDSEQQIGPVDFSACDISVIGYTDMHLLN